MIVTTLGRRSTRDGYRKITARCSECSKVLAEARVGNDAGRRYFVYEIKKTADLHTCSIVDTGKREPK